MSKALQQLALALMEQQRGEYDDLGLGGIVNAPMADACRLAMASIPTGLLATLAALADNAGVQIARQLADLSLANVSIIDFSRRQK